MKRFIEIGKKAGWEWLGGKALRAVGVQVAREVWEGRSAPPDDGLRWSQNRFPRQNTGFVGRADELERIGAALTRQGRVAVSQAIAGLGGVGKSEIARAYGHVHAFHERLWLDAEQPSVLIQQLAALSPEEGAAEEKARAALRAIERGRKTVLLVYDNVEDRAAIEPWLPVEGPCHTLITTRIKDWPNAIDLDVLPAEDAADLLGGGDEAADLAHDLGYLPLALAQAAAFMQAQRWTAARYRARLAEDRAKLLSRGAPDGRPSLLLTFGRSIEAAEREAPGAALLLDLLAWFAAEPVPREVLAGSGFPAPLDDEARREDATAALARYSLISLDAADLALHRLVQDAARSGQDDARREQAIAAAAEALHAALPGEAVLHPESWPLCRRLAPHAELVERAAEIAPEAASSIANQLAIYHYGQAAWPQAEPLFRRAIEIGEKTLSAEHPELARNLNNLAALLEATGRFEEAEPLYRRDIEITEKTLGAEHPDLAKSLNNLAGLLVATGRFEEAEPRYRRAIAIGDKTLGAEHPELATSLNNLANLLVETGRFEEAEPLLRRAIAIGEKTIGGEHPDLATWLSNLAGLLRATGRFEEAEPLYRRAIEITEKTLGDEHPDLAKWRNNLALLLEATGRFEEAEPLYRRAIEIGERTLGAEHPNLAIRLLNLGDALCERGGGAEGLAMVERGVRIFEKALPAAHPHQDIARKRLEKARRLTAKS